ncbi:MAG: YceI family protein [Cytophagales bacterium]|nr:YceI family protein [Cytophagales bacterium]
MKKVLTTSVIAAAFLLVSCGGGNEVKNTENTTTTTNVETTDSAVTPESGKTTYLYQNDSTKVSWTAYKTTDKKGVGGQFTTVNVTNVLASENPLDVVKGAKFSIPVSATVTGNEVRDSRIMKFFFGMLSETENITGQVKSLNEDGTGSIAITFNGIEKELPVTCAVEGEKITVKGTMDVNNWNGQAGIEALNLECKDLHAGADGITKLWPDVDIVISTILKKEIN